MIYFTADLHFYHEKIIKSTNRPFRNADEMNKVLVRKWNEKVTFEDDIYILGDFTMKGAELAAAILSALKGRKHLIRGNHDQFVDNRELAETMFISVQDYAELIYANTMFVLCHYPFAEWNGYAKGSICLHGHQHNHEEYNIANRREGILRYDVGVYANHMTPVSAEEVIAFFVGERSCI